MKSIISELSKRSYFCEIHETDKCGEASRLVMLHGKDKDIIVCSGGDGTLHEVVNGLMKADLKTPVFYVPLGTTNDMARTLELTIKIDEMEKLLDKGVIREQDAGKVNDISYLTFLASFGAFSEVSYKTPQRAKKILGYLAYWLYSIKSLGTFKPYYSVIHADGKKFEGNFFFGCVSNSTSVAGLLKLDREKVDLSDGRMELMLIHYPYNALRFFQLLIEIINKKYTEKHFVILQGEKFLFEFKNGVEWAVDGEYAGMHQRVRIEVTQKVYNIYTKGEDKKLTDKCAII